MQTTDLTKLWQLKPHVHVLTTTPEHAVISWLGQRILIKSSAAAKVPQVFELLRTPITLTGLEESMGGEWSRDTITNLLNGLAKRKLVFSNGADPIIGKNFEDRSSPWWPYFNLLSSSADEWRIAIQKVNMLKVHILTRMKLPSDFLKIFKPELMSIDQTDALSGAENQLSILILSSADTKTLERISHSALASGTRILPVFLDLSGAIIGPVIGPQGQPCLRCLSKRLQASSEKIELVLTLPDDHLDAVEQAWPFTSWLKLSAILQDEIFKLESGLTFSALQRGAYLFDFFNQRSDYDEVFPIPGCDCSLGVKSDI